MDLAQELSEGKEHEETIPCQQSGDLSLLRSLSAAARRGFRRTSLIDCIAGGFAAKGSTAAQQREGTTERSVAASGGGTPIDRVARGRKGEVQVQQLQDEEQRRGQVK